MYGRTSEFLLGSPQCSFKASSSDAALAAWAGVLKQSKLPRASWGRPATRRTIAVYRVLANCSKRLLSYLSISHS